MSHLYILYTEKGMAKDEGGLQEKITCKVGITSNPKARFGQLQTGMHELIMAYTWKLNDASLMEKFLHKILAVYNLRSEWFIIPQDDLNSICLLLQSVSLFCNCDACKGYYYIERVAQEQVKASRI